MSGEENSPEAESYWYAGAGAVARADARTHASEHRSRSVEVLRALRHFHAVDFTMRQRLKTDMDMNETDLRALRHLIAAESRGNAMGPKNLTRELGISSAATAKLLARMAGSGHIRREVNPRDRRAQLLYATADAHHEVRKTLGSMHERMLGAAESLTAEQQKVVIHFLHLMSAAVDASVKGPAPKRDRRSSNGSAT